MCAYLSQFEGWEFSVQRRQPHIVNYRHTLARFPGSN